MSAARWTKHGNLVITAGPATSEKLLNSAITHITLFVKKTLNLSINTNTQARINIRWSRILLNRVPTGTTESQEAHNPKTCHKSLMADNPSYTSLTITQRPSWVKAPSSYEPGSVSSLAFAFEDPDGSLAIKLLSEKELYIFGANVAIKKWKQKPPTKKPTVPPPRKHTLQTPRNLSLKHRHPTSKRGGVGGGDRPGKQLLRPQEQDARPTQTLTPTEAPTSASIFPTITPNAFKPLYS